jgi:hypothetical protein
VLEVLAVVVVDGAVVEEVVDVVVVDGVAMPLFGTRGPSATTPEGRRKWGELRFGGRVF